MEASSLKKNSWKNLGSIEEAFQLIDYGILLKWKDIKSIARALPQEDQVAVMRHFTKRLCERADNRLSAEIIVESMLIWMANAPLEPLIEAFIDQIFDEPGRDAGCRALVEIALTAEVTDNAYDETLFSIAVVSICELGLAIFYHEKKYPGEFPNGRKLLDHIATYLLSVSNNNSTCTRLSLLHYFGVTTTELRDKTAFNRIMNRFGHTVLDNLFSLLFRKRSEAIALQFLLENLPYVLEADIHSQRILHETFKQYMLKNPDRFSLFLQTLATQLHTDQFENMILARKVFLQHLGSLLNIVSEVNHRILAKDIALIIMKFDKDDYRIELIDHILTDSSVRPAIKELLGQLKNANNDSEIENTASKFEASKRGRKPSFTRADYVGTTNQVTYLGSLDMAKAS